MGVTAAAVHDYGDRALLLEFGTTAEVLAWTEALRAAELPGVVDLVPAAQTVLMILADSGCQAPVRQRIGRVTPDADSIADAGSPPDEADVVLHVTYDGADLDEVARLTGLSVDEVVAAHTGRPWRVGFCGFAPGFGYLLDGDERLQVPRRAEPRTKVPVGAVALAGSFSGVYPRESPGGWQLIGRTDAALWDIDRDEPALLTPGRWVQFQAVTP